MMRLIQSLSGLMFTASVFMLITQSAIAETDGVNLANVRDKSKSISTIPQANAALFLTQNPGAESIVEVTGVRINQTERAVEVILETNKGDALQPVQKNEGNRLIIDIPNSQLRDRGGDTFRQEKPFAGIAEVLVVNQNNNTIQVTVTGEAGLPTVELFDGDEGLIFGVTPAAVTQQPQTPPVEEKPASETPQEQPSAATDEPIELVVTGQQDNYRVPNATTGTRTDTPLRDIPQSIQVIPRQVIEDRQPKNLIDALRSVPGISQARQASTSIYEDPIIRGF